MFARTELIATVDCGTSLPRVWNGRATAIFVKTDRVRTVLEGLCNIYAVVVATRQAFLMRLKYFKYFQGARANRYRESRVVVCATGCISHISPSHVLTQQTSVAVTKHHSNSFLLSQRDGSRSQACLLRGSNPNLLHIWANIPASEQLTANPTELAMLI